MMIGFRWGTIRNSIPTTLLTSTTGKDFKMIIQKAIPKTKSDLIKALSNSTIKEIRVFDETNCSEAITLIQKFKGTSRFEIIITK